MSFHRVVVLGAGPIGLLAAIEAREKFGKKVSVTVVEKRTGYTRTNVPALAVEIRNEFKRLQILPELGFSGQVPFSKIEEALKARAVSAGVKFELGYTVETLVGASKNKYGRYKSMQLTLKKFDSQGKSFGLIGQSKSISADLLIVSTGGAAAADPVVTQTLGFTFHKLHAKNYGAYGVFVPHEAINDNETADRRLEYHKAKGDIVGGAIGFETPDHNYLLVTLSQCSKSDFKLLQTQNDKLRELLLGVGNSLSTAVLTEIKEVQKNVAIFKIAIQRAGQFYSKDYPAVIVGDAAVTPHPEAGSGIGTGYKGFQELKVLFQALSRADRSDDNEAAFKTFADAYELHVSKKALEGTKIVLLNLIKLLNGFCDVTKAAVQKMANPEAKTYLEGHLLQAATLQSELTEEKKACERFEGLLKDSTEQARILWDEKADKSVNRLWLEIDKTYRSVKKLTGDYHVLAERLLKIEAMLKFDAKKAVA